MITLSTTYQQFIEMYPGKALRKVSEQTMKEAQRNMTAYYVRPVK